MHDREHGAVDASHSAKNSANEASASAGRSGVTVSAPSTDGDQHASSIPAHILSDTTTIPTDKSISLGRQNALQNSSSHTSLAAHADSSERRGKSPAYLSGADARRDSDDRAEAAAQQQRPLTPASSGKASSAEDVRSRWLKKLGM